MMNLYRATIETYFYGKTIYHLYILAETGGLAKQMIYNYPKFRNDEDAKIVSIDKIDTSIAGIL